MLPKFFVAHSLIYFSSLKKGYFGIAIKAFFISTVKFPKILLKRYHIQKNIKVSNVYVNSLIENNLPPKAKNLQKIFK